MAIQYKDWRGAASISKKFAINWETFLYKWVLLAKPLLGQLIPLCGSLLSWEPCCSAIPSYFILGAVPSEPDPWPAAAEWVPCSVLVMGLIPDLMDHLEDKRISVSGTIQPRFVPSLTARRALVALGFWRHCTEALEQHLYRAGFGGRCSSPCRDRVPAPLTAVPSPAWLHAGSLHICFQQAAGGCWPWRCRDVRASRDAGTTAVPPAVPPLLPPSRGGFGPPRSRMRTLLFALKARPERVTRWQQQTQEGPQMGFLAAGWFS